MPKIKDHVTSFLFWSFCHRQPHDPKYIPYLFSKSRFSPPRVREPNFSEFPSPVQLYAIFLPNQTRNLLIGRRSFRVLTLEGFRFTSSSDHRRLKRLTDTQRTSVLVIFSPRPDHNHNPNNTKQLSLHILHESLLKQNLQCTFHSKILSGIGFSGFT